MKIVAEPSFRAWAREAETCTMADALIDWERNHPGVDPQAGRE